MNKKAALGTVFLVVLVDLMGFGIVLPLLPFYASRFNASPLMIGALFSVYSLAQLVFSPIWGAWSDRIGRRPVMLLSTFGASICYILLAFAGSFQVLIAARLLAGVMGGNISAAQAYVADVTDEDNRARGMGLIGAAFGIGFALGPALSGILVNHAHANPYTLPGLAAAVLSATSFVLVLVHLPESLAAGHHDASDRIQKVSIFNPAFWDFLGDKGQGSLPGLLGASLILAIGQSSLYAAFPLFCQRAFGLTSKSIGGFYAGMGFLAVMVQGGLIRHLVKRFGEKKLFVCGGIFMSAGLFALGFSPSPVWLWIFLLTMTFGASLNGPTLTSLLSKEAPPGRTGAVLGRSQGLSALGRVIGPSMGGWLYGHHAKLPFVLTALLVCWTIGTGLKLRKPAPAI